MQNISRAKRGSLALSFAIIYLIYPSQENISLFGPVLLQKGRAVLNIENKSGQTFILENPRLLENSAQAKILQAPDRIAPFSQGRFFLSSKNKGEALLIVRAHTGEAEKGIDLTAWILSWAGDKGKEAKR